MLRAVDTLCMLATDETSLFSVVPKDILTIVEPFVRDISAWPEPKLPSDEEFAAIVDVEEVVPTPLVSTTTTAAV